MKTNILFIGMPGTGKSTLGKLLAEYTSLQFVDVDALIDASVDMPAQKILDTLGDDGYGKLEETALNNVQGDGLVIATGGSAIYQQAAILRLKKRALIIHLQAQADNLLERINDFEQRAIVRAKQLSFVDLYAERMPLYSAVADIEFYTDQEELSVEKNVEKLITLLDQWPNFHWIHAK